MRVARVARGHGPWVGLSALYIESDRRQPLVSNRASARSRTLAHHCGRMATGLEDIVEEVSSAVLSTLEDCGFISSVQR